MVSLAGMSAAYPGYQTARQADNQIQAGDIANQNALLDQQGTEALGRTIQAFQASIPGAQPMGQAPMPGQPSQPMAQGQPSLATPPATQSPGFQPGPSAVAPQMQSPGFQQPLPVRPVPTQSFTAPIGGGPASAPQGQPAAMQGMGANSIQALQGKLDLKTLMGAIAQANPGAKPAVIAAAVTKALPLLNAQAQMDWKQMSLALAGGRLENARAGTEIRREDVQRKEEQGGRRLDQGERRLGAYEQDVGSKVERRGAQTEQGAQRIDLAGQREKRLAAQADIRNDQRWQQLEVQKRALEERVRQGGDRTAIAQWRAIVDAQHKRAVEIIQSSRDPLKPMDPVERKALLKEQNDFYEGEIKRMRGDQGATTPTNVQPPAPPGGGKVENRMPQGGAIPGSAPAQAPARPRAKNPQTGEELEFDGKTWVPIKPAA